MALMHKGICSGCQDEQEARPLSAAEEREGDDLEDGFVIVEHCFMRTAMICAGSGTTPETHARVPGPSIIFFYF